MRRKFLARLKNEVRKRGVVEVLRNGVKHGPHAIALFYATPSPGNPQAATRYDQNRLYDGACGTGGMLTVAEETLQELARARGKNVSTHLYGQEINVETYAICKVDLLLKGEGSAADNIVGGPEHSTLSNDAFPAHKFDFMLSNPPYGKSWKQDLDRLGGKRGITDPRFIIAHDGDPNYSLLTRSSDGQMLFLANMIAKIKGNTALGSRIAEVHNGSSLFGTTREILRRRGRNTIQFSKVAIPVLNQVVRPFTAKWHRESLSEAF